MIATRRRILLVLAMVCLACAMPVGPDGAVGRVAMFERVWRDFDLHYAFFEHKRINWDSLHVVHRPGALAATSDGEFADAVWALLIELRDPHVRLDYGGVFAAYPLSDALFDPSFTQRRYLSQRGVSAGGHLVHGMVAPSVGYVAIADFEAGDADWSHEFDRVLDSLPSATRLIIDLRHNVGGSADLAIRIAGRFAPRATTYARVRYRSGPGHGDFTDFADRRVTPQGTHPFAGPVYLLTNRRTASAAEDFVLALQVVAGAITVGDTTAGATGSPLLRELPNGWTYQVPAWIEYTLDGRAFEGTGLPPAHVVKAVRDDRGQVDRALERAIGLGTAPHD